MKLFSGRRIGQSGHELTLAVFFSFFIHAAVVAAALFFYLEASPRVYVPPSYNVKLVELPAETAPAPVPQNAPLPPAKEEKKAEPKAKQAARTAPKKAAMPELSEQTRKLKTKEIQPSERAEGQPQKSTAKTENVSVNPQEGFKYSWYLANVRDRIAQNWRPPPDAPNAKARVIFSVNRSGWVMDVNIDSDHSNGTMMFTQAAIRAIRSANPFPPLPEDFGKQSLVFSVDLTAE
jgi:periplasmic protein TonB